MNIASIWTNDEKLVIISNFGVAITALLCAVATAALTLYTYRVWVSEQNQHDEEMARINAEAITKDHDIEELNANIEKAEEGK